MPKVTRQQPTVPPPTKVAAPVRQPTDNGQLTKGHGLKVCTYGDAKTGKTRFAGSFVKAGPMLLIGFEDGWKSLGTALAPRKQLTTGTWISAVTMPSKISSGGTQPVGVPTGIDFVRVQHSSEMEEITDLLRKGAYASSGLDTAGKFELKLLQEKLGYEGEIVQKTYRMAERADWMAVGMRFKQLLSPLFDLADRQGLNVVVIAHERSFGEPGDSTSIVSPKVGAALTPSSAGWLHTEVDYLAQCFKREKSEWQEQTINGVASRIKLPTGKIEYCLRVGEHSVFLTGFRLPPGSGELPDAIIDPSYSKVLQLIEGK